MRFGRAGAYPGGGVIMSETEGAPERVMPLPLLLRVLRAIGIAVGLAIGAVVSAIAVVGALAVAQAVLVRGRLTLLDLPSATPVSGTFGADNGGTPLRLGLMGDSLAVGYAADDPQNTPGVILANGLAAASDRPVILTNVGEVGAESSALLTQLVQLQAAGEQDVVVIVVGANDVMHVKRFSDAVWPLSAVVRELRRGGSQVVVATCPDLGTIRPFGQPLRFIASWMSRVLAVAQAIVTLRAGGRTVSLGDIIGPLFTEDPSMFSPHDRLHPSDAGYRAAASVILPSVRVAAGAPLLKDAHLPHRVYRKGKKRPLVWWAFRASRRAGARLTALESTVAQEPPERIGHP